MGFITELPLKVWQLDLASRPLHSHNPLTTVYKLCFIDISLTFILVLMHLVGQDNLLYHVIILIGPQGFVITPSTAPPTFSWHEF